MSSIVKLSNGNQGDIGKISGNGKFWTSRGDETGDYSMRSQAFRRDINTGESVLITSTKEGVASTGDSQFVLDISEDGRFVLFIIDWSQY